jgi:translation initiation factor 5B
MVERQPEFAVILAFKVKIQVDARELSIIENVQIFEAEIIYHLFDMFSDYMQKLRDTKKAQAKDVAVFPCEFRILDENHVFHNGDPFILGCEIQRGTLRLNTPIIAKKFGNNQVPAPLFIGHVTSIQKNNKDLQLAKTGDKIAIKIVGDDATKNFQVGRQFNVSDPLLSQISRESIDALKRHFKDDTTDDDIKHLHILKSYFNIF